MRNCVFYTFGSIAWVWWGEVPSDQRSGSVSVRTAQTQGAGPSWDSGNPDEHALFFLWWVVRRILWWAIGGRWGDISESMLSLILERGSPVNFRVQLIFLLSGICKRGARITCSGQLESWSLWACVTYTRTSRWPQGQWCIIDVCFLGKEDFFFFWGYQDHIFHAKKFLVNVNLAS